MEIPAWCLGVQRHGGLIYTPPWPVGWEADEVWFDCEHRDDGHLWELVYSTGHTPTTSQYVVRCWVCHVPRCGDSNDRDPCMHRRHHSGDHLPVSRQVPDLHDPAEVSRWLAT